MLEWQGLCKSAGVAGLMLKCGTSRAYVGVGEWQRLCKSARVAGLM